MLSVPAAIYASPLVPIRSLLCSSLHTQEFKVFNIYDAIMIKFYSFSEIRLGAYTCVARGTGNGGRTDKGFCSLETSSLQLLLRMAD